MSMKLRSDIWIKYELWLDIKYWHLYFNRYH